MTKPHYVFKRDQQSISPWTLVLPSYPSSVEHAPWCDCELTPNEFVICYRNTATEKSTKQVAININKV